MCTAERYTEYLSQRDVETPTVPPSGVHLILIPKGY